MAVTLPSVVAFSAYGQQEGLEEIVVTATRREENLQQVPISIVAVTGDSLEMRGLDSLERVSQAIPNLVITGGGGGTAGTNFTVRGIPNVGTYIDGVWQLGTSGFLTQQFVDIDRIEVLRGPQGTEFGRDSTGGALRIWTKKPTQDFGADLTATIGSLDRRDVKATVNIPISDKLLTKWTAANLYRDGYIHDLTTGLNNGGIDQKIVHGDILWMPTDKLTWRFNYQTDTNQFTEPRIQDAVFPGTLAEAGQGIGAIDFYGLAGQEPFNAMTQTAGYPGGQVGEWQDRSEVTLPNWIQTKQFSSDVTWELSNALKLEFISAQTFQEARNITDWDNSQYQLVEDVNQNRLRMTSQEMQISGGKGKVKWVGGAYYWNQLNHVRGFTRYQLEEFVSGLYDINAVFNSPTCQAIAGGALADCQTVYNNATVLGRTDSLNQYTQDGWALFGEATISLTDKLDLTVGLRHHNQNDDVQPLTIVPGVTAPRPASVNQRFEGDVFIGSSIGNPDTPSSFDKNTSRLSLQDQFTDNVMGYIAYSEGFNSGGATAYTDPSTGTRKISVYKPQTLKNTEIGIRSDLANKHLRLNATLFNTIWDDIQAAGPVIDPVTGRQLPSLLTTNVGSARARGAELEMTIVPTEKLLFNVNVGYLDTAYTDILPGTLFLNTNTAFQQAPKNTGSLGVQYNADLKSGSSIVTRLDYLYQSQFWRSLAFLRTEFWAPAVPPGFDESGGSGITNLRMTYEPANADWNLSVFGTNLSNERLINSGFFHGIWGFDFATVGRPREFGVQMNFKLK